MTSLAYSASLLLAMVQLVYAGGQGPATSITSPAAADTTSTITQVVTQTLPAVTVTLPASTITLPASTLVQYLPATVITQTVEALQSGSCVATSTKPSSTTLITTPTPSPTGPPCGNSLGNFAIKASYNSLYAELLVGDDSVAGFHDEVSFIAPDMTKAHTFTLDQNCNLIEGTGRYSHYVATLIDCFGGDAQCVAFVDPASYNFTQYGQVTCQMDADNNLECSAPGYANNAAAYPDSWTLWNSGSNLAKHGARFTSLQAVPVTNPCAFGQSLSAFAIRESSKGLFLAGNSTSGVTFSGPDFASAQHFIIGSQCLLFDNGDNSHLVLYEIPITNNPYADGQVITMDNSIDSFPWVTCTVDERYYLTCSTPGFGQVASYAYYGGGSEEFWFLSNDPKYATGGSASGQIYQPIQVTARIG